MDGSYEHIVIGAGLAGSVSAFHLSDQGSTLLLEKDKIGSGASGALSGLVNPFMSRKANPTWQWREALDAFEKLLSDTDSTSFFRPTGVLRPAAALPQKMLFRDVARAYPDEAAWLQPNLVSDRWPAVSAPSGALFVRRGGGLEMQPFVRAVAKQAEKKGCEVRTGSTVDAIDQDGDRLVVKTSTGVYRSANVLLCVGGDYGRWPALRNLPLHPIKGQLIETPIPPKLDGDLPCLSGAGYVVPHPKRLVLGSTFRHRYANLEATKQDTEEIIRKTGIMLPALRAADIRRAWTGIRVTVPGTRLPIVAPVAGLQGLFVFTGLGAKGVLMSSLLGARIRGYLRDPESIPPELRPW